KTPPRSLARGSAERSTRRRRSTVRPAGGRGQDAPSVLHGHLPAEKPAHPSRDRRSEVLLAEAPERGGWKPLRHGGSLFQVAVRQLQVVLEPPRVVVEIGIDLEERGGASREAEAP